MRQYYIPYKPGEKKFNYLPVLYLYRVAKFDTATRTYNKIKVQSLDKLADMINTTFSEKVISKSTLSRVLRDKRYNQFFLYDKDKKEIVLKNDFRKNKEEKRAFIVLSMKEFDFIIKLQDNLLIQYLFYLKYYCGISKTKKIDSTIKQFLSECGYSSSSGNYVSRISEYNRMLSDEGIISIKKKREDGKERNIYYF